MRYGLDSFIKLNLITNIIITVFLTKLLHFSYSKFVTLGYNLGMAVSSAEIHAANPEKTKFDKVREVFKWVSIGFLGFGALIGVPVLVAGSMIDLGMLDPLAKETVDAWNRNVEKLKSKLNGKKTSANVYNSRELTPA